MKWLLLLFLLSSCSPSVYYVVTQSTFKQVEQQPNQRKIIYLFSDSVSTEKLISTASLLNRKNWKTFDRNINSFSAQDRLFFTSIKYLLKKDYLLSYKTLQSLPIAKYDCQVEILKTDCLLELGADTVNFKDKYQNAMNCAQTEEVKSIIRTRYRFLRYDF